MSVKIAVILVVTPRRLIEIYHPFFFYHEDGSGNFLHLYGGNRPSCFHLYISKFLQDFKSRNMKLWITEDLCNRCSAACTSFTFSESMGQCCPFKCTSFSSKREIVSSGNLKWILLRCNRNLKFQRPYSKPEVRHAVLEQWKWLSPLLISRKL